MVSVSWSSSIILQHKFWLKDFHWHYGFVLVSGPVEADPEYRLIVAANNLTVEIDNELSMSVFSFEFHWTNKSLFCTELFPVVFSDIIHKFTRDKYSKRFPELESLVPDSLDYIRTVKVRITAFVLY